MCLSVRKPQFFFERGCVGAEEGHVLLELEGERYVNSIFKGGTIFEEFGLGKAYFWAC